MLEPGKCLWLFLQAAFWCLGVWAMDQQDVPAGREWSELLAGQIGSCGYSKLSVPIHDPPEAYFTLFSSLLMPLPQDACAIRHI